VTGALAVVLRQRGEDDRADRHVDAHAERVRAADDLQEPALGELLHQDPVLRQHAGVVHADALLEPLADVGAVRAGEAEILDRLRHRVLLLARAEVETREVLCAVRGVLLGEAHHVHRRLPLRDELLQRLRHRDLGVRILERDRPLPGFHGGGGAAIEPGERLLEKRHVAEGGGHEQEAGAGQGEQRHLPGHAAVAVCVPVELVHDHVVHRRVLALAQGDVGQHLRRAAQDGCVAIDGGVSGREADVLGTELPAEGHPLLVHQGLDGRRVHGASVARERHEMERGGDERLSRAGRRVQDDVPALEQLEDRLLLGGVELQTLARDVIEEEAEQVGTAGVARRQEKAEGTGHEGG
jgi:hypothetical protein